MALLFSRLDQLENFRAEDGKFHLKIVYPELGGSNEWIQTSNPATESTIEGLEAVKLDYTVDGLRGPWGGLGLCTGKSSTFICDTPTKGYWFMAIGSQGLWGPDTTNDPTIPGPRSEPYQAHKYAVRRVEVYVTLSSK